MLKVEVAVPATPGMDFDFNEARPMPFLSAPTTPRRFGDYTLSAPSSPSHIRNFYSYFDSQEPDGIPFDWEEKPGTPKSPKAKAGEEDDFAFDFSVELEKASLTADQLFDGGKIRPLKPPPRLQMDDRSPLLSPRSPRSPRSPIEQGKKMIRDAFSPRKKKEVSDPFASYTQENQRGRERVAGLQTSSSRRAARSLSPYRVSAYPWDEEEKQQQQQQHQTNKQSTAPESSSSSNPSSTQKSSSKRWRLRDLLLFRSSSDGRAYGKDPLRKYTAAFRKQDEVKDTSFRSTDSATSSAGSSSRRRGRVSAHELHYTANKAASDNLKKKTFLPYKQGILGRFAFNPNPGSFSR
ncbi:hypothetical protein Tsubulata_014833 [Turnera subulata]|uniref:Uncharacterized protein n=1 Tax=Turnera subulata TaxID=218843 RepID=A0A9Q0J7W3_9ROSI|nr:hypothetical protein Tsubulata_014833 [Turnera subulata]